METIYSAGRQAWKIAFVFVLSLLCGGGLMWVGWDSLLHYGTGRFQSGELAPLGLRILLGGGMLAVGLGIVIGILIYPYCYVMRIERGAPDEYRVTLAALVGRRRLEVRP
ncbi:MAG TPA: hypothetical protein VNP72_03235, partial [Longimicrobium sp.]|nr:hypothetical protein [Longimicrobium sp.]